MSSANPAEPEWTILKLLAWATSYFKSNEIESPRAAAEILLAHALGFSRLDLYLCFDKPLVESELSIFKKLIVRRLNNEPVAYIVGEKEFWSLAFSVSRHVLIPRPETECLVEETLSLIPDSNGHGDGKMRVLELGTGSGAVITSVAYERPGNVFFASDISLPAVMQSKQNSAGHGLRDNISFFSGNWFAPLKEKIKFFDIIVSNPPYIPAGDINTLQPEIRKYEPETALDGGEDGLDSIRNLVRKACVYLKTEGHLLLEIGYDQKEKVQEIIDSSGSYENVVFRKDYSGNWRVVRMQKKDD